MVDSLSIKSLKAKSRKDLRECRRALNQHNPAPDLYGFLDTIFEASQAVGNIAGYAPIGDELNIWPLLKQLHKDGHAVALPVVINADQPLQFRSWHPDSDMQKDRFGVSFPSGGPFVRPGLIFVPLLGFTSRGERLGYGGGYYDRTLAHLRESGEVFACGVAYAGQEEAELPTDAHDAKLDGILTENGFRAFE